MKTLLSIVILALAGAVIYLWTQLQDVKKELKKDEPKVTINIQKNEPKVTTKNNLSHDRNQNVKELEQTLKRDFQKIFKDVFGDKEVQTQIKESMSNFKKGLNQAITELQKQVNELSKNDDFFNKLSKELGTGSYKVFEDKGSFYELKIDLHQDRDTKVDIDSKEDILSVKITSKIEQKTQNKVVKKKSMKSYIVKIPQDGVLDMIKSEYKDGVLYITIPKKSREKV
jgi:HSP20 family molecular chaperone IbpA